MRTLRICATAAVIALCAPALLLAAPIERFVGSYSGEADVILEGEADLRDLNTTITSTDDGFSVTWSSGVEKIDGRQTNKTYTIEFLPSDRSDIYGSAMKTNVFGKNVPLDPLKGEPFVWARLEGDTLSLFSLFINEAGDHTIQEYHRTLAEGGLNLRFVKVDSGEPLQELRGFLKRED